MRPVSMSKSQECMRWRMEHHSPTNFRNCDAKLRLLIVINNFITKIVMIGKYFIYRWLSEQFRTIQTHYWKVVLILWKAQFGTLERRIALLSKSG